MRAKFSLRWFFARDNCRTQSGSGSSGFCPHTEPMATAAKLAPMVSHFTASPRDHSIYSGSLVGQRHLSAERRLRCGGHPHK